MLETLDAFAAGLGIPVEIALLAGIGLGGFFLFVGVASAVATPNPAAVRLAGSHGRKQARLDQGILKPVEQDPTGLLKSFVPASGQARSELRRKLAQAGYGGKHPVLRFMVLRLLLGLALPAAFLAALSLSHVAPEFVPRALGERLSGLSALAIFQITTILLGLGYFLPSAVLNSRVAARQRRIIEGFPNALDLMRVSLEAGLGFDAAMTRVGNELRDISPDIAYEFLGVQHEVLAGRGRDKALQDLADRIGLDFVHSFANVVRQSMQFGTSMTDALTVYAEELREHRELKAQEMANKLPVKMSAVLASLMLPALLLLCLGPMIIRYTHMFN